MRVLVPLAGKDEGFLDAFGDLKPFVPVQGVPLIKMMLNCLPFSLEQVIFVVLKDYDRQYDMSRRLKNLFPGIAEMVMLEALSEGSLCSALMAQRLIDDQKELLIDLADVYFRDRNMKQVFLSMPQDVAGIIPVMPAKIMTRPWGYVYPDTDGNVRELKEKEKQPDSDLATLGLYYFRRGADFVRYAQDMIRRDMRLPVNKLFYVGPLYNLFIEAGQRVATCQVDILHVFGNVADLKNFQSTSSLTQS